MKVEVIEEISWLWWLQDSKPKRLAEHLKEMCSAWLYILRKAYTVGRILIHMYSLFYSELKNEIVDWKTSIIP